MYTRQIIIITSLVVLGASITGCSRVPYSGVVGWNKDVSSDSLAPDIPFTSVDGKELRLNKIRKPITILAFIQPVSERCCSFEPDLLMLAERVKNKPITVAQVSLPTDDCPLVPGCRLSSEKTGGNLVLLYDSSRIAWKAYNQPKPNTIILIDEDNKIVDIQPIENLKILVDKALNLAWEEMFDGC